MTAALSVGSTAGLQYRPWITSGKDSGRVWVPTDRAPAACGASVTGEWIATKLKFP
jgi:hypothetical protein